MATTGAKTNLFEDLLLNHFFRGGAAPATGLYIGLITGNPTFDDANAGALTGHEYGASEAAGSSLSGYSRVDLSAPGNLLMGASSTGVMSSTGEINFGTSTAAEGWGSVTGFIISSTATIGAGDTYYYGVFDTAKSVATGDSVRITAGNLTIEER